MFKDIIKATLVWFSSLLYVYMAFCLSFQTLVTLDEAKGDDEEIEELEQSEAKPTSPSTTTQIIPEEPVKSPSQEEDACDLDELRKMNFVTVDEVGEEEEEEPSEEIKEEMQVKKRATRAKKRARQTPGK